MPAVLGSSENMTQVENHRERETIAFPERGNASVHEENGGLELCWTRTDELVELAARSDRMRHFQTC